MSPGSSSQSVSHNQVSPSEDEDGWQDMPVVRNDDFANGLDEEDQRKYHYVAPDKSLDSTYGNATGNIDFDKSDNRWRSKLDVDEGEYTRLRLDDEEDTGEDVHLRTKYLFDEDKAMTPLSQMQATKGLLTEAQRIAYVGLCALAIREMANKLTNTKAKEMKAATESLELWGLKIMGRLYYHMELATSEQKMIESLADHGVQAIDLVPSLMTTHTVANPEYDPVEAKRLEVQLEEERLQRTVEEENSEVTVPNDNADNPILPSAEGQTLESSSRDLEEEKSELTVPDDNADDSTPPNAEGQTQGSSRDPASPTNVLPAQTIASQQTKMSVLQPSAITSMPGVSTTLSSTDASVTLDIRWTILCDLFLLIIADSVYDSRSRVLLENVASKLGLGWIDVMKFEKRVTDALEIQEDVEEMEQKAVIEGRIKAAKKKRYVMMGLATIGGGLVIGLSAGLLAPVIGAGLGAAFTTIGVTGTTSFFAGAGGAALITTSGALTGSGIAVKGMARRTKHVRTFELLPLHNNKRVNCIITVPGFMQGLRDDVRLPFSVLDPLVGDVFSVLWEPEMMEETGNAIKLLTGEILSQLSTTVLQATIMTGLMSALTWPIILTKLGYLIDNPWSNALDRARAAGSVLADILFRRHLGVRPIMLIGFSLGARVIFYALLELAKAKAYGVVQDVFLLGATLTASNRAWLEARSVVAGRLVNGYARNDWVLNYLYRATSGGINAVAGLGPITNVPGVENVDVTDKVAGHGSYRAFMPLILDQLGFPVSADYFNEPEEPDMVGDRDVITPGEEVKDKKGGWFSRKKKAVQNTANVQRPPSSMSFPRKTSSKTLSRSPSPDDLPERIAQSQPQPDTQGEDFTSNSQSSLPLRAGFDFKAINELLQKEGTQRTEDLGSIQVTSFEATRPRIAPVPVNRESSPQEGLNDSSSTLTTPSSERSRVGSGNQLPHPNSTHSPDLTPEIELGLSVSRSLSLNDANDAIPHLRSTSQALSDAFTGTSATPAMASTSYLVASQLLPTPNLSFESYDGSVWTPGTKPGTTPWMDPRNIDSNGFSPKPPFSGSVETLSFGSSGGVISQHSTPFSASNLSFGGADGSISYARDGDPWAATQFGTGSKKRGPSANPWDNTR